MTIDARRVTPFVATGRATSRGLLDLWRFVIFNQIARFDILVENLHLHCHHGGCHVINWRHLVDSIGSFAPAGKLTI